MKVVLDTNVLASAAATRGLCADVLREVLAEHELVICKQVIDEGKNVFYGNWIEEGICNTGIHCDGCTSEFWGNHIAKDKGGDGIYCENGAAPTIHDNNILAGSFSS